MLAAIRSAWALFVGLALIMVGNGLQNTLLGVRAEIEGFSTSTTGVVMSGYFLGFLLGSLFVPQMVRRVGHVRVFAAMAAIASTAVLIYALLLDPYSWFVMRLATGVSFAGLYIVVESWLNHESDNAYRGQVLAFYMVVVLGGIMLGQALLNASDPAGFQLFVLSSVLISIAVVPILLTVSPAPAIVAPKPVGLRELYRISPLGVIGAFGTGMAHGALYGMAAVYATSLGLSVGDTSLFVGAIFAGALLLQWPIGRLSDRFDRRRVLTIVTLLAGTAAFSGTLAQQLSPTALILCAVVLGGLSLPLYSLCIAYMNDYLEPEQMVAASGTLFLASGAGASLGPLAASMMMDVSGPPGFFFFIGGMHGAVGLFAVYRMSRRHALPLDEQGPAVYVASSASSVATALSAEEYREQVESEAEEVEQHSGSGTAS